MACIQIMMLWAAALSGARSTANSGDLTIDLTGFRNDKGYVLLSLFNNASGFPGSADKAYLKEKAEVKNGRCVITFPSLAEGTYAVAVLHDENKNLKMDLKLLVLPKEGFGFSQNAGVGFGPPAFSKASFRHTGTQLIAVRIRYF